MTAVTQKQSEVSHVHKVLFTLGYEGQTADEVFHRLEVAGVRILMDVRYRPQSRKSGLSKSNLAQTCAERGMIYVHDRDLGTPPEMMDHVKAGGGYDPDIYAEYQIYLSSKEESLRSASERVRSMPTCLLCYEADANNCHRKIVAEELARRTGLTVEHL
ncbi:MAG: DUF488 domain-containing protein [Planctomycetes bacterium]|nr:DUF488 domain-containing protein [Planctomycetota bacterium]